jgi:hypothetical protein
VRKKVSAIIERTEKRYIPSELTGEWMSALLDSLPPGEDGQDRVLAWMLGPRALPPAADPRASADLGKLLDMLGAPPPPRGSDLASLTGKYRALGLRGCGPAVATTAGPHPR